MGRALGGALSAPPADARCARLTRVRARTRASVCDGAVALRVWSAAAHVLRVLLAAGVLLPLRSEQRHVLASRHIFYSFIATSFLAAAASAAGRGGRHDGQSLVRC